MSLPAVIERRVAQSATDCKPRIAPGRGRAAKASTIAKIRKNPRLARPAILHIRLINYSPRSRLVAVLGPTNTGKTHLAVERMLAHSSGMIGLPLRLLAREIYDRIVKTRGKAQVALITGEEKIVPADPRYFVCTVEAMPLDRKVEFLAVTKSSSARSRARPCVHPPASAWRAAPRRRLMGAATVAPVRRLCPDASFQFRERLSRR